MVAIDMEMPKSCADYPLNKDDCWCSVTMTELRSNYDRTCLDDCPLIDLTDNGK